MLARDQKRLFYRHAYEADVGLVLLCDTEKRLGRSLNISYGGLLLKTDPVPEIGANVTLLISLPELPDICLIPCKVRWSNPVGQIAGLEFQALQLVEAWGINRLILKLEQEHTMGNVRLFA